MNIKYKNSIVLDRLESDEVKVTMYENGRYITYIFIRDTKLPMNTYKVNRLRTLRRIVAPIDYYNDTKGEISYYGVSIVYSKIKEFMIANQYTMRSNMIYSN
jgi:hypothetical protein